MIATKYIYIVRHGESTANEKGLYQGPDAPLSERGRAQATFLAERFARIPVEVILSSTMRRAHETAEEVRARIRRPLEFSDLLRENRTPSEIVGVSRDSPEGKEFKQRTKEHQREATWRYSDEESFEDLTERGRAALTMLATREEQRLLVLSHGEFIRVLVGLMLFGEEFSVGHYAALGSRLKSTNTGITWCEFYGEDRWVLRTWMDHAHLGEPKMNEGEE